MQCILVVYIIDLQAKNLSSVAGRRRVLSYELKSRHDENYTIDNS